MRRPRQIAARRLGRTLAVAAALLVVAGAAWLGYGLRLDARLLRSDPEAIPGEPALLRAGAARGAGVFAAHCATCHGADGHGDRGLGVPDLTDADWLYGPGRVADIEKVAAHGVRAHDPRSWNLAMMPAYGTPIPSASERVPSLAPGEIAAVADYILALGGHPADPASVRRGGEIYSKAGCYDCHTADAKGDPAIGAPNLVDRVWLYGDGGRAAAIYSIAHGRAGMCPAWSGRLSPLELREVSLYVYALSHATTPHKVR
ncbi:MAG: c-type cytochrome [Phenylobacterium sp.]|nr:c-type cytochrome [Phenylobacterium sp.]